MFFALLKFAISEKRRELNKLGGFPSGWKDDGDHHWLDRASDHFGQKFVQDLKRVLKLVVLFLPVTTFWALFDQQVAILLERIEIRSKFRYKLKYLDIISFPGGHFKPAE